MLQDAGGAVAYLDEREDALVIDNPNDPPPLRALAEDEVPHIIVNGERHKLPPDRATCSCGLEYHAGFDPFVPEALEGAMCTVCFTPHERAKAEAARKERVRYATDENQPLRLVDNPTKRK